MFEQFSKSGRAAFDAAFEEAGRRGDRRIGTEHLFLGLFHTPRSPAARALGLDLVTARMALDTLDRSALTAIGIDPGNIDRPPLPQPRKRAVFTSGARAAMQRTLIAARSRGERRLTPEHLLLALLDCRPPDPAGDLMDHLRLDRPALREHLRKPRRDAA